MMTTPCRTTFALFIAAGTIGSVASPALLAGEGPRQQPALEFIKVGPKSKTFVFEKSQAKFQLWGFNYDHDADNRLLETYWEKEWGKVEGDFLEMVALGANTVRIHLQVGHFMRSRTEVNSGSLAQLDKLVKLAESTGLYLDVTGLGCYDKAEVPQWYNDLDEEPRWEVQARFWEAVARVCNSSPAVFCYDLMNEPVVTEDKKERDWTPGAFGDRYFVQRLTLDFKGRTRQQIAKAWVEKMVAAIRKHDRQHLITVGVIPWALTWPNAKPLFYSPEVGKNLDFACVHFYPKEGEVDKALKALEVYDIGKPLVIEEMFPLSCSLAELEQFIDSSRSMADGWIGFYWGKSIQDYRDRKNRSISETITMDWLVFFARKAPEMTGKGH